MTLYCNGTGNPSPQTAWIKSGKVLVTDSAYVIRGINRSKAGIITSVWLGMESSEIRLQTVALMFTVS